MSPTRRPLARVAVSASVLLLLTGCGTGLKAQTYLEKSTADSTNDAIGFLAIRNLAVLGPPVGTSYPAGGEEVRPDWLLVPLVAFDRAGRRLGYGGGYYDRTLAALPGAVAVGCAHSVQEMPVVPAGPDDVRLPWVATENGVIECPL